MKNTIKAFSLLALISLNVGAIEVDCSMSDTTPCDCIFGDGPRGTLPGTDCRVCRVEGDLSCVLWGSGGTRYAPLCEDPKCPPGFSWKDQQNTPGHCYCDWQPKEHERMPCTTPAGDCKCSYDSIRGTTTVTSHLPGETCTVCAEGPASEGGYFCTERGNKKEKYGPLCMGSDLGPPCNGEICVCDWYMTIDGPAWKNDTDSMSV